MYLGCCMSPPVLRFDTRPYLYSGHPEKGLHQLDHHLFLLLGFPMGEGRLLMLLAMIFAEEFSKLNKNP